MRLLRALSLPKPVLLEGSPGVGKTSLVAALARASGHSLVRVNLSEQSDMMDLLGADLPAAGGAAGEFAWADGPLLSALRSGHWVLLDELNLAPQAVLEGLNALLDHRREVYVPELDAVRGWEGVRGFCWRGGCPFFSHFFYPLFSLGGCVREISAQPTITQPGIKIVDSYHAPRGLRAARLSADTP